MQRISTYIVTTPLVRSTLLSKAIDGDVYLKLENVQVTGSFKIRGVLNKLLSLLETDSRVRSVVTASTGNHGVAVAYAFNLLGLDCLTIVPEKVLEVKLRDIKEYGCSVKFCGSECLEAELYARRLAQELGFVYVSPYNDLDIVAGHGTIAVEISRELKHVDAVLVPVSGGGLVSGVAAYLKHVYRGLEVIGSQPVSSPAMYESIRSRRIVRIDVKPTIADGIAGNIEPGSITFDLCRELVDGFVLLSEDEIAKAIGFAVDREHILVEGTAALPIAVLLKERDRFRGKKVVLIIAGSRIDLDTLKKVLSMELG